MLTKNAAVATPTPTASTVAISLLIGPLSCIREAKGKRSLRTLWSFLYEEQPVSELLANDPRKMLQRKR